MNNFTKEDLTSINGIIGRYRNVSAELTVSMENAKKLQKRIDSLETMLKAIKKEEDELMKVLHDKYGDFSLQDIYDALNYGE